MTKVFCAFYRTDSGMSLVRGPHRNPIACAASSDHFVVLDDRGTCYGLGDNKHGKLHKNFPQKVERFSVISFPKDFSIREVAVGAKFSAFVTTTGIIIFHGKFYKCTDGFKALSRARAPRGLSANSKYVAFCGNSSSVFLFGRDSMCQMKIRGENVIKTCLTENDLIVLTSFGNVYRGEIDDSNVELQKISIDFPVLTIFSSLDRLFVVNRKWVVYDNELHEIDLPYLSNLIHIGAFDDENILRLDHTGKLQSSGKTPLPEFEVSCFSCFDGGFVAFHGHPKLETPIFAPPVDLWPICGSAFIVKGRNLKLQLLAVDAYNAYFKELDNSYGLTSELQKHLVSPSIHVRSSKEKERPLYYTPSGRLVFPAVDGKSTFAFNCLTGDIVETPGGVKAKFVGFTGNDVWLQTTDSRCVSGFSDPPKLRVLERPGHQLITAQVDGMSAVVDVTPSFVKQFGRAIGDLVWFPMRGIVRIVGMAANKFVFLDFSDYSLFSSDIYNYLLIRTDDKDVSRTRDIVTTDGEIIELDVCSSGRIFQPGDRVMCEFGDATFIGTDSNGHCYVQSDEMRVSEIQGARVDISNLKLMRRIGMKATRRVTLDNNQNLILSLSVFDRVNEFFADDIITTNDKLCRIIGIDKQHHAIYAKPLEGGDIFKVNTPATLVYRADILGGRHSDVIEVGTPAYELSALVPNDLVRVNGEKEYIFKGIGRSGLIFADPKTRECFATSYAPLVMPDSFEVLKRSAFVSAE